MVLLSIQFLSKEFLGLDAPFQHHHWYYLHTSFINTNPRARHSMPVFSKLVFPPDQPSTPPTPARQSHRERKPSQKLRDVQSDPFEEHLSIKKRARDKSSDYHTPQRRTSRYEPNSGNDSPETIRTGTGSSKKGPNIKWVKPRNKGSTSQRRELSYTRRAKTGEGRLETPSDGKLVLPSKKYRLGHILAPVSQYSQPSNPIPNPLVNSSIRRQLSNPLIDNACGNRLETSSYGNSVPASRPEMIIPFTRWQSSQSSQLILNPLGPNPQLISYPIYPDLEVGRRALEFAPQTLSSPETIGPQNLSEIATDVESSDDGSHNDSRSSPELRPAPEHSPDLATYLQEDECEWQTVNREVSQSTDIGSGRADMFLEENPGFSLGGHDAMMNENGVELLSTAPQDPRSLASTVTGHVRQDDAEASFEEEARRMQRGGIEFEEESNDIAPYDGSQELVGVDEMMRGETDDEEELDNFAGRCNDDEP